MPDPIVSKDQQDAIDRYNVARGKFDKTFVPLTPQQLWDDRMSSFLVSATLPAEEDVRQQAKAVIDPAKLAPVLQAEADKQAALDAAILAENAKIDAAIDVALDVVVTP